MLKHKSFATNLYLIVDANHLRLPRLIAASRQMWSRLTALAKVRDFWTSLTGLRTTGNLQSSWAAGLTFSGTFHGSAQHLDAYHCKRVIRQLQRQPWLRSAVPQQSMLAIWDTWLLFRQYDWIMSSRRPRLELKFRLGHYSQPDRRPESWRAALKTVEHDSFGVVGIGSSGLREDNKKINLRGKRDYFWRHRNSGSNSR